MNTTRNSLKKAVDTMLKDVIERGYKHMVNFPQESDELNRLVNEANETIFELNNKIDNHNLEDGTAELSKYYHLISKELDSKSLDYLSRLQEIQRRSQVK